jgi:predicted transcriptional regulator
MKFPPTSDIRKMRKTLDMTQAQLADASGVSQSTIAKIESEKISASYTTVVRLFETLNDIYSQGGKDITATDIASKGVVTIQSSNTVHEASDLMKSTGYSQLPVMEGEIPVGSISERGILEMVRRGTTMDDLSVKPIYKVMSESFPIVTENTPIATVTSMMANCNAILVSKKGKIVGLITSADMLKLI